MNFLIPYFEGGLYAGFPSPAADYMEKQLNLQELLVEHPAATFFIRVEGDSMTGVGMFSGDILVVDRSLKPQTGRVVVAILNGEFTVKQLHIETTKIRLVAANPRYPPIEVTEDSDFQIWGVVTFVIHKL